MSLVLLLVFKPLLYHLPLFNLVPPECYKKLLIKRQASPAFFSLQLSEIPSSAFAIVAYFPLDFENAFIKVNVLPLQGQILFRTHPSIKRQFKDQAVFALGALGKKLLHFLLIKRLHLFVLFLGQLDPYNRSSLQLVPRDGLFERRR